MDAVFIRLVGGDRGVGERRHVGPNFGDLLPRAAAVPFNAEPQLGAAIVRPSQVDSRRRDDRANQREGAITTGVVADPVLL